MINFFLLFFLEDLIDLQCYNKMLKLCNASKAILRKNSLCALPDKEKENLFIVIVYES